MAKTFEHPFPRETAGGGVCVGVCPRVRTQAGQMTKLGDRLPVYAGLSYIQFGRMERGLSRIPGAEQCRNELRIG